MKRSKVMTVLKLKEVVRYIFPEVKEMFYVFDKQTGNEAVLVTAGATINYKEPGEGPLYQFEINVTADSPAALVDDVWKALKRRFA